MTWFRGPWPRVALLVGLLVLAVWLGWREAFPRTVVEPTPDPNSGPVQPVQATQVADVAQRSSVELVASSGTAPAAILVGDGQIVASLPPANVTPVTAQGTPMMVDRLRGIALAPAAPGIERTPVALGTTLSLKPGDEIIAAPPGREPVVVRYAGQKDVPIGTSGLGQLMLDLELPDGVQIESGPVLDRRGRLIGVISAERQAAAPAGHAYAVAVEHIAEVIQRPPDPAPARPGRPTPRPLPTVDESVRIDEPGED